jgi:hypothetical protein
VCVACPSHLFFLNYLNITSFARDGESKTILILIAKHVCNTNIITLTYEALKAMGVSCKVHRDLATHIFVDAPYLLEELASSILNIEELRFLAPAKAQTVLSKRL